MNTTTELLEEVDERVSQFFQLYEEPDAEIFVVMGIEDISALHDWVTDSIRMLKLVSDRTSKKKQNTLETMAMAFLDGMVHGYQLALLREED